MKSAVKSLLTTKWCLERHGQSNLRGIPNNIECMQSSYDLEIPLSITHICFSLQNSLKFFVVHRATANFIWLNNWFKNKSTAIPKGKSCHFLAIYH